MGKIYSQLSIDANAVPDAAGDGGQAGSDCLGVDRSASTLSRELSRNGWVRAKAGPGRSRIAGGSQAVAAQERAHSCTTTPHVVRCLRPPSPLWPRVVRYLKKGYSPEQFAGTLALVHTDTPSLRVSHETIDTAIYAMPRGELCTQVIGWLRFGHAKRRPGTRDEDLRGRIPNMVSIHDRPPEIEEQPIPGHCEGDLIKGAYNQSAVGALVERTTLITVLSRMEDASAESAVKVFSRALDRIDPQKRL